MNSVRSKSERIADIIRQALLNTATPYTESFRIDLAHRIVEAFPELQQQVFIPVKRERVPFVVEDDE